MFEAVAFYLFAFLTIAMFYITVTTNNALYALSSLAAGMIFISGFFFLLGAEFLGVVQLIVYSGAVMALYAFGMMFFDGTRALQENVKNPKEYLELGQEINVEVIDLDCDKRRLRVSLKTLQEKPFKQFVKTHKVGDMVTGEVLDIKDFGVFVKLENNLDGLIRKEDLLAVEDGEEELKIGETIESVVVNIDRQRNRVRLSVKRLASQKERDMLKSVNDNTSMTLGDAIKGKLRK